MTHRLTPGQPLVIPAAAWNRMDEASDDFHRRKKLGELGQLPAHLPILADRVKVKNMAGEDLPAGAVVEIGDPAIDADQLANGTLWFEADQPSTSDGIHAILRKALPDGEIGEAQLAGAVMARVNVNSAGHRFARPVANETYLDSAASGPVKLLNPATGSGVQLLAVLLGVPPVVEMIQVSHDGKTDGDLVAANAENVHPAKVVTFRGGTKDDEGTVWLRFADYHDDDFGGVFAEQGRIYGPAVEQGTLTVESDTRPLFVCHLGEQECLAKSADDVDKGSGGTFALYSDASTDSGLTVTAVCEFNAYTEGKWAIVKRINGAWYANQVEC